MIPAMADAQPTKLSLMAVSLVLAFAFTAPANSQSFYKGTDVVELTPSSLKSKVLKSQGIWMVEFYAPWCGHCQRLKPDYIKAASSSKGIVHFGAINCDEHGSVASEYGVKGYPTLKIFGKNKNKPQNYQGERTARAMTEALTAQLPNHVKIVGDSSYDEFIMKNPDDLKKLPIALLFTTKTVTSPLYKALALNLKDRMILAEARAKKSGKLLERYSLTESKLPRIVVHPSGSSNPEDAVEYEGSIKYDALFSFLEKYASTPNENSKDNKESKPKIEKDKSKKENSNDQLSQSTIKFEKVPQVIELNASKDVQNHCLHRHGYCIVGFISGTNKDDLSKYIEIGKGRKDSSMKFLWVDLSKHPSFVLAFSLDPSSSTIAIINPKKKKYTTHVNRLDDLNDVLDRALGGDLAIRELLPENWATNFSS